jgi:hypothetical protein
MDCVIKITVFPAENLQPDAEHFFEVEFGRRVHLTIAQFPSRSLLVGRL